MPLSAHKTPRMIIPLLDGNDVAVRGFNLDDFAALMPNHFDAVSKIALLYSEHKQSVFSGRALSDFIIATAKDFPGLVSEVISIAADEPESRDVKLSTGLQLAVLSAIVKLTVEEAGGLGNLFGQLRVLGARFAEVRQELADVSSKPAPSKSSTGNGGSK